MNNAELQDAINETNRLIIAAEKPTISYDLLSNHLKCLLAIQKIRANEVYAKNITDDGLDYNIC